MALLVILCHCYTIEVQNKGIEYPGFFFFSEHCSMQPSAGLLRFLLDSCFSHHFLIALLASCLFKELVYAKVIQNSLFHFPVCLLLAQFIFSMIFL